MPIEIVYNQLLEESRKLNLNEEAKKSRVTFKNPKRVFSLEKRKAFVLIHLPKRKKLAEFITKKEEIQFVGKSKKKTQKVEVDHIGPFKTTYDSRGWTYIRVAKESEVPEAVKILEIAKEHNS